MLIQTAALVLAAAVAFFINRTGRAPWRLAIGSVAGLGIGFLVAFVLALAMLETSGEAVGRALGASFWFALVGAVAGTVYGRRFSPRPPSEESERKNKTTLPVPYMIGAAAVILGAAFLFSTGGSGEKSAAQPRQAQWDTENLATCILDQMPEVQNDITANAVLQVCNQKHPGGIDAVTQGSGRGPLDFDSGAECTAKKAADTRSNRAAALIRQACMRLYDEDGPWLKYQAPGPSDDPPPKYLTDKELGYPEKP